MMRTFLFVCLLATSFLQAKIVEVAVMTELFDHITPDTLIVFDIDNTIMEPVQELGSDQWFCNRIQEYKSWGLSKEESLEKALREWTAIQSITRVKLVEPGTDRIVMQLQTQKYTVMGLTTRGLGISTRTIEQLATLSVDLSKTPPCHEEFHFMNAPQGVLFRGGVLFTAGTHKGRAFAAFLEKTGYQPKRVVFINDKLSDLVPVEETCDSLGIPFVGLRYNYTDAKVKHFRKHIADVQLQHFGHIISDEAAERMLFEREGVSTF